MKLFLGITLPQEVRQALQTGHASLRSDYPYYEWVDEAQYHITVADLGERSEHKMPIIKEAIEQSTFDIPRTRMYSIRTSVFQREGIEVYQGFAKNKEIESIRARLVDLFSVSHENKMREKFTPHTIVARYKLPSKQQYLHLKKKLSRMKVDLEFEVREVHLFEVITNSTNPEYEILHTFELVE